MHGIISRVNTEIESVTVGKLVCKFGVNVVKIISATVIRIVLLLPGGVLDKRLGQNIEVSTAQRNIKCGFFSFTMGPSTWSFAESVPMLAVPLIFYRRRPSCAHPPRRRAVLRNVPGSCLYKALRFKRFTVENGKKSPSCDSRCRAGYRPGVTNFIGPTAPPHIQTGRSFCARLHAGQQLQGFNNIVFTQ